MRDSALARLFLLAALAGLGCSGDAILTEQPDYYSESGSDELASRVVIEGEGQVFIVDRTGKRWEVGHARKYGLDPTQYQFGLGPYAIAPLNHPTFLFPGEPGFPGPSDMMVLGVDMNETIRAYPTWTRLVEFEVINENLGGGPVAVAF